MALLEKLVVRLLPAVPKSVVRRFSRPYIAGERIEDALSVVRSLNGAGALATLDILGEDVTSRELATASAEAYREVLKRIAAERLDSNVSVKLSQMGLKVDRAFCRDRVASICETARDTGNFVRIDMEDSSCTEATLAIYHDLRASFANVGCVIQAYLRRSADDVARLAAAKANVRLCKGIYVEPRAIAFKDREIVRRSYVTLLETLLGSGCYVGIATHDERLAFEALNLVRKLGLSRDRYEFQMLLGVDTQLRDILVREGHRLRVYIPYGSHWYPYSLRRLKENPAIAGHIVRSLVAGSGEPSTI
ncbi:MAG: proline dehydrogenase family protein [Planctomycetes bacterium]|nr:proline dehydrogenase family protein [Planctomycetota bacterium]MBI3847729.1 proline dehydrogenase family protein [Planctomycetota bacterium]